MAGEGGSSIETCPLPGLIEGGARPETKKGLAALEKVAPPDCPLLRILQGEGGLVGLSTSEWRVIAGDGERPGKIERMRKDAQEGAGSFEANLEESWKIWRFRDTLLRLMGAGVVVNAILFASTALRLFR